MTSLLSAILWTSYEFDLPPPRSITKNYLHVDCSLFSKYFADSQTLLTRPQIHQTTSFKHTHDFDNFLQFSNPGNSANFPGLDRNTIDQAFTIASNPSIRRKIYPRKSKSKSIKYFTKTTQTQTLLRLSLGQQQQLTYSAHRQYVFLHNHRLLKKQLLKWKFIQSLSQNRKTSFHGCLHNEDYKTCTIYDS